MQKLKWICCFIFICSLSIQSCNNDEVDAIDYSEPSGRRLREIMDEKFPDKKMIVGVSCGLWAFDYACGAIVDNEFNYVTPETDFKQRIIHPNNVDWNFDDANKWIIHAEENHQIIRMHCPIGPQVSDWTKEDRRTSQELEKNMTDFLMAICTTYNAFDRVKYMDVVNETVKNGNWFEAQTGIANWENPWTKIGFEKDEHQTPLYIKKAFAITNKYAPNIKQLYNHQEEPNETESWNLIKETILSLKSEGIRIDAIGWQAHVDNGWASEKNLDRLRDLIDWTHQNNMEFHITEASSFIKNQVTDEELILQAETYSKIVAVLLEKSVNGNVGWNTWHLTDAHTYRSEYSPSMFDKNFKPKPAYYAIQKKLEEYKNK